MGRALADVEGVGDAELRGVAGEAVGGVVLAGGALGEAGRAGGGPGVEVVPHAEAEAGSGRGRESLHRRIADRAGVVGPGRALDAVDVAGRTVLLHPVVVGPRPAKATRPRGEAGCHVAGEAVSRKGA